MINLKTDYPILKGDPNTQMISLQNTVCNLLDELKVILPQIDDSILSLSSQSGNSNEESSE